MIRFIILVFLAVIMFLPMALAENFEYTACYSGTYTLFHNVKELPPVLSYAENSIATSDDKRFNNMTFHCEGVQLGLGNKREVYGYCTSKDIDGNVTIVEIGPYSGSETQGKFIEGTGKWKGVTGSFEWGTVVRSKQGQAAMPGTYQGCRRVKGKFELPK